MRKIFKDVLEELIKSSGKEEEKYKGIIYGKKNKNLNGDLKAIFRNT